MEKIKLPDINWAPIKETSLYVLLVALVIVCVVLVVIGLTDYGPQIWANINNQ